MRTLSAALQRFAQPGQWWLALASLACGIALVVGIELARGSAVASLAEGQAQLDGTATHYVQPIEGRIAPHDLGALTMWSSVIAPLQQAWTSDPSGRSWQLRGIDPQSESALQPQTFQQASDNTENAEHNTGANDLDLRTGVLAPRLAGDIGDTLTLTMDQSGYTVDTTIVGHHGFGNIIITDLSLSSQWLGYDSIDRCRIVTDHPERIAAMLPLISN